MTLAVIKHWSTCRNKPTLKCSMFSFNTYVIVTWGINPSTDPKPTNCVQGSGKYSLPSAALYPSSESYTRP